MRVDISIDYLYDSVEESKALGDAEKDGREVEEDWPDRGDLVIT